MKRPNKKALTDVGRVHAIIAIARQSGDDLQAISLLVSAMCTILHRSGLSLDMLRAVTQDVAKALLDPDGVAPEIPSELKS